MCCCQTLVRSRQRGAATVVRVDATAVHSGCMIVDESLQTSNVGEGSLCRTAPRCGGVPLGVRVITPRHARRHEADGCVVIPRRMGHGAASDAPSGRSDAAVCCRPSAPHRAPFRPSVLSARKRWGSGRRNVKTGAACVSAVAERHSEALAKASKTGHLRVWHVGCNTSPAAGREWHGANQGAKTPGG